MPPHAARTRPPLRRFGWPAIAFGHRVAVALIFAHGAVSTLDGLPRAPNGCIRFQSCQSESPHTRSRPLSAADPPACAVRNLSRSECPSRPEATSSRVGRPSPFRPAPAALCARAFGRGPSSRAAARADCRTRDVGSTNTCAFPQIPIDSSPVIAAALTTRRSPDTPALSPPRAGRRSSRRKRWRGAQSRAGVAARRRRRWTAHLRAVCARRRA